MEKYQSSQTGINQKGGDPAKLQELSQRLRKFYEAQNTIPSLINISDQSINGEQWKQKLDDYYVKLENEVIDDKKQKTKQTIEIQQLFGTFANQQPPKNVLIKGNAGMGKTTFLKYFAYKWGKQINFCSGSFNFLFRVPLKHLAKQFFLQSTNTAFQILVLLIIRQFSESEEEQPTLTQEEVKYILDNGENIVLLLDGFDEISNYYGNDDYKNVKKVIDYTLIKSPKLKILMTSRPNAIRQQLQKMFGRIIESKGLNLQEAKNYITKFFQSKQGKQENGKALLNILESNSNLASVIQTPINLFMLCFVASENKEAIESFNGSFPLSKLYDQTLLWTTKRYKHKWEKAEMEEIQNLTVEHALMNAQVIVLKNLAYQKFTEGKYQVSSKEITNLCANEKINPYQGLLKIYRFGLLRMKGNGDKNLNGSDLNNKQFDFVHLSFQEHLTASVFKQNLESPDKQIQQKAANFIATHRNQPRYLMVLKILSGLINASNSQAEQTAETIEKLRPSRTLFWEAVVCNVDGILELGADTKIKLLMHLLSQCNVDYLLEQKIPHIEKICELIDKQVLNNLEKWSQSIISAGYLSDAVARHLEEAIKLTNQFYGETGHEKVRVQINEQNDQLFYRFKLVSKIIPHFMHKPLFKNKQTVMFLTTLRYKKDEEGNLMNEAMTLVVLENIYRLKNYNKMENKDNFIIFSQKIVQLFFYERTEQLAIKIFHEICLSQEYGFKTKHKKKYQIILTQLSNYAFQQLEMKLSDTNVSLRQILRLIKFHEAYEKINGAISYQLGDKMTSTYLEKMKSDCTGAINNILTEDQSLFLQIVCYFYENLKQILTLLPRLDKTFFQDIKKLDWRYMPELPFYDLMSIGNKQLTDNLISFLKEAKQFEFNQKASWRVVSCSWEIFANSKIQIKNHEEFKDLIDFQKYFFYELIQNKQMEVVKRAVKKHPELITLIMNVFQQKLPDFPSIAYKDCQIASYIKGLSNLRGLIQILPDIIQRALPYVRRVLNMQSLKINWDFIEAVRQAAKNFPACMLNANIAIIIIILEFRWQGQNYLDCVSNPMIWLFKLIKKNAPKDLIPIFRRLVASNEDFTREKVIRIYRKFFESQQQTPIAQELLEQLLPLYHDPSKKVVGEFLKLITKILESKPHSDLQKKMFQQSKPYFQFQDKSPNSRLHQVVPFIIDLIKSVDQQSEIQIIIQLAQSLMTLQDVDYCKNSLEIWIELLTYSKVQPQKCFNSIKKFDAESEWVLFELKMGCFGLIASKSKEMCKLVLSQIKQLLSKTEEYKKISFILKALQNILVTFPQMTEALDVMNNYIQVIESNSKYDEKYFEILHDLIDDNQFLAIHFIQYFLRQSLAKAIKKDNQPLQILFKMIQTIPIVRDKLIKNIQAQIKAVQNDKQVVLFNGVQLSKKQFILLPIIFMVQQKYKLPVDLVEQFLLMVLDLMIKLWGNQSNDGGVNQILYFFYRIKLPLKQSFKIIRLLKDMIQLSKNRGEWNQLFIIFAKFMTIADAKYLLQSYFAQGLLSFYLYMPFEQLIKFQLIEKHISLQPQYQRQIFKNYEKTISKLQTEQDKHKDRYKKVAVLVELSKIKELYNTAQSVLLKIADDFKTPETLAQSNPLTIDHGIDVTPQQKKMFDNLPEKEKTRKLTEFATKMIQQKVQFLNKLFLPKQDLSITEKTEENYIRIVESQYVRLNTNIPLARQFMKKVAHHLLSDDGITADDCQFIINCIKCDLTINVSSNGSIVIDDRTYSFDIKQNLQARKYFEQIVSTALKQNRELAKQYTTFEPYFQSSTNLLAKSASDFKNVKSIMMPNENINDEQNILSFIQCENKVFCLIEQRSFFGDCLVYKVGTQSNLEPFTCHPSIIEAKTLHQQSSSKQQKQKQLALKKFKEDIFGPPNGQTLKIFSKTMTVSQKNELLSFIKQAQADIGICSRIKQKILAGTNSAEKIKWQVMGYSQFSKQALHFQGINAKNMMQQKNKEWEVKIQQIELTLQDAGAYEVADINRSIKKIKESSQELGTYYRVMYWTLSSFFNSFLNSNTGMVQVNKGFDKDKMQGYIQNGAIQLGKMAIKAAKGIPFIGGLAHYLDGAVQKMIQIKDNKQFNQKKDAILKIIMGKMQSNTGMSMIIQKTVIQIIRYKQKKILEPKKEESITKSFWEKFKDFLFEKGSNPFGKENLAAAMAVKDSYLLLSYLYKRQKDISNIKKEQLHVNFAQGFKQFQEKLDKKIADQKKPENQKYENNADKKETSNQKDKNLPPVGKAYLNCGETTVCTECCLIYKFEARYDNKILNYPSLIKLFMKQGIMADLIMHGDENEPRESLSKEE